MYGIFYIKITEVTVILVVEFAVGMIAVTTGFLFKHTYFVSEFIK